ncbi:type II secretion system GspH family protein [Microbacterium azadirachtae]|uniref:type II secretion system protein n=1 Tax=Microbacterium azadirachtae TaxID=582680 RepID=UPI0021D4F4C1|nr:type II secretion system protein [Microbacterium azadirachtae]UXW85611.1 type II secretion system GspH family protein [Microbacterium azadirachtae]
MSGIRRALEAKKAARENGEEAGFSLIELIIVVVILGILVAIAIPIFAGIQQQAKDNSLKSIAASAASAVAADLAKTTPLTTATGPVPAGVYKAGGNATVTVGGSLTLDGFCVTATGAGSTAGGAVATAGPGC